MTLAQLDRAIARRAAELGVIVKALQSNHEGTLVDALHAERHWANGVVINPAAFGATSYALRDAIAAVAKPTLEVHLDDPRRGEPWRRKSVLKELAKHQLKLAHYGPDSRGSINRWTMSTSTLMMM